MATIWVKMKIAHALKKVLIKCSPLQKNKFSQLQKDIFPVLSSISYSGCDVCFLLEIVATHNSVLLRWFVDKDGSNYQECGKTEKGSSCQSPNKYTPVKKKKKGKVHSLRNAYIKVQVCKQATFFNLKPCLENCSLTACVEVKAQDQWRPVGLDSMEPFITAKWFYIYRSNMDVSTCTEPECVLQEKTNTFNVNVAVCSGWHNFTTLLLTVWGWGVSSFSGFLFHQSNFLCFSFINEQPPHFHNEDFGLFIKYLSRRGKTLVLMVNFD